jgi:Asp-tRNA(Asn)/Glu-tRNA(Gln) amidotransferase C subunit
MEHDSRHSQPANHTAAPAQRVGQSGFSPTELGRIAQLSQLAIEPSRLAAMASDLSRILELAKSMGGEDVAKLPPLLSPLEARSLTRADDASLGVGIERDSLFQMSAAREASDSPTSNPRHDGAYFKVPKVLGDGASGGAA